MTQHRPDATGASSRVVPTHWTNLLGAISWASLAVVTVTGVILLFHYDPSVEVIRYDGSYLPLRGLPMSQAYASTLHISMDVRGGLLVRQVHHWAALVLPASLMLQLAARFFTGAFRRPRRLAWFLLVVTFLVALVAGWSGYALPDDTLSGTGLHIFEGLLIGTPLIGTRLTLLVFGGEFPADIVTRMYWLHVAIVPVVLVGVLALRYVVERRQPPPQFRGGGRTADTLVGLPRRAFLVRATGMFVITVAALVLLGGTLTVAPIWLYGPTTPEAAAAGSQPDWYTAWLDGALRLVPPGWEVSWLGHTWPLALLIPQAVAAAFLAVVMFYPVLEQRLTKDHAEHHLLVRPREAPRRTALGAAGFTFFGLLWLSGSTDIVATRFHVAFETQVWFLRAALLLGTPLVYAMTVRICRALQEHEREEAAEGYETGVIMRSADGGYTELHAAHLSRPTPSLGRRGHEPDDQRRPDHPTH